MRWYLQCVHINTYNYWSIYYHCVFAYIHTYKYITICNYSTYTYMDIIIFTFITTYNHSIYIYNHIHILPYTYHNISPYITIYVKSTEPPGINGENRQGAKGHAALFCKPLRLCRKQKALAMRCSWWKYRGWHDIDIYIYNVCMYIYTYSVYIYTYIVCIYIHI